MILTQMILAQMILTQIEPIFGYWTRNVRTSIPGITRPKSARRITGF
jgi:hypothetical protein